MQLVKQQRFTVRDQDGSERQGCASIYEYKPSTQTTFHKTLFAVSIYIEHKPSFVNRTIESRAKAEKIYNAKMDDIGANL